MTFYRLIRLAMILFQSSPSPKTGRYTVDLALVVGSVVPILTQSEDWALCFAANNQDLSQPVPILTQSEDWALFQQF